MDKKMLSGSRSLPLGMALLLAVALPLAAEEKAPKTNTSSDLKPDERVKALLDPIREKHDVPGMVAAILKEEKIVAIGATGLRKHDSHEPITIHDQVHLGSCTKAMTATLIGLLVERKKLAWQTTIVDVFPEAKDAIHEQYHPLTLLQLLTHRASLPHDWPWRTLGKPPVSLEKRLDLLKKRLKEPPKHEPGSRFQYSNVGYVIAGMMAEKAGGASYEELLRKELFTPLGMKSAGFGAPGTPKQVDQPWGHTRIFGLRVAMQTDNHASLGPAGTVHCSLADWAKFAALHLRGARGNGRLLRPDTFAVLHMPPPAGDPKGRGGNDYACGWNVGMRDGKLQWLTHAGSNNWWFARVLILVQSDTIALVAVNQGGDEAEQAADEAIRALRSLR